MDPVEVALSAITRTSVYAILVLMVYLVHLGLDIRASLDRNFRAYTRLLVAIRQADPSVRDGILAAMALEETQEAATIEEGRSDP